MCRLSRPILLRVTTTIGGTDLAGLSRLRLAKWSTDGVAPRVGSPLSSYNKTVDNVKEPVRLRRGWFDGDSTTSCYNHRNKVQPTGLLHEWFSSIECESSSVFLVSGWDLGLMVFEKAGARMLLKNRQRVEQPLLWYQMLGTHTISAEIEKFLMGNNHAIGKWQRENKWGIQKHATLI